MCPLGIVSKCVSAPCDLSSKTQKSFDSNLILEQGTLASMSQNTHEAERIGVDGSGSGAGVVLEETEIGGERDRKHDERKVIGAVVGQGMRPEEAREDVSWV